MTNRTNKVSNKCIHNIRKYECRECDGRAFCKHDKRKDTCR